MEPSTGIRAVICQLKWQEICDIAIALRLLSAQIPDNPEPMVHPGDVATQSAGLATTSA